MSEWKLRKDGQVDLSAVTGHQVIKIHGASDVFLIVHAASAPEHLPAGDRQEQFSLTPQAAIALGEDLIKTAKSALEDRPSGPLQ